MLNKKRFVVYLIMCTMLCSLAMGGCGKSTTSKEQETEQMIRENLEKRQLPATKESVQSMKQTVVMAEQLSEISPATEKYLVENAGKLETMLIDVPLEVDQDVAVRKLAFMGKEIDTLTEEQIAYLNS